MHCGWAPGSPPRWGSRCRAKPEVMGSYRARSKLRLRPCEMQEGVHHMGPTPCQKEKVEGLGKAPAARGGGGNLPHGRMALDASKTRHRAQQAQHIAQQAQREMPHALVVPAQQGAGGAL